MSAKIPIGSRRIHPLLAAAAIAIIVLCSVGVAAILGWLPGSPAQDGVPQPSAAMRAEQAAVSGPEAANLAPAAACPSCGVVAALRQVQVPKRDNSNHIIGTVAGGVVGGVVGNQFGGGHGKDALTVLGAVGGALAGREVERNIRQQDTVTQYELTVRMADGSKRLFHSAQPFTYGQGDAVRVENNQLLPR
ncbi:glycine zipper 2TM domain-containing protein [Bordetella holmesii]|uniref:glycine zipper 2TM domain-containing protein n=1 Tax=Bordetella holmesii TaxID=35814 RepID=UPI00046CA284|nr:glycine zipper 2TM domain-containing protein [Bordetella holmesii]QGD27729.1 glycine zipper 2TM domain-containing protein [Bordetella holmesii]